MESLHQLVANKKREEEIRKKNEIGKRRIESLNGLNSQTSSFLNVKEQLKGTIEAVKIMSLALVPLSIVKIYTSKFLALEKSRFIIVGMLISLSILILTIIIFGQLYEVSGIAMAYLLASIIQATYFFIINKIKLQ